MTTQLHFPAGPTRRTLGLALLAAGAAAALPAWAQTTIAHAKGSTTLAAVPKKVLVFDLAALDTLQALGVDVQGVPGTKLPAYLSGYSDARYTKIGTLFEPDLEVVHAAKADLIIVAGRSSAKYTDLARIAPTIDLTVNEGDFLNSVYRNTQTLGRIFGQQAKAQALVEQTQASIERLKPIAAKAGKGLVVLTTGGRMSAYGPGSRFGVLHDGFGVPAVNRQLNHKANHGQAISFEFILQNNPDWLFVLDRDTAIGNDGQAARRLLDNELVRQTTAWRKQQVVYLDAANWYTVGSAGMTALRANVDQLAAAFQRAGAQ